MGPGSAMQGPSWGYPADKTCLCNTCVASTEPKDDGGGLSRLLSTAQPLLDWAVKPASGTATSGGHLAEGKEGAGARTGQGSGYRQDGARAAGDGCY